MRTKELICTHGELEYACPICFVTDLKTQLRECEQQLSAKNDEITLLAEKLAKAEHRLKIANEISKDQLDATNEWIEKYKQECIKVKEAEKVIEFYADRGNWQISDLMTYSEIIDSDLTGGYIAAGGGKARQYFKDNKLSQKGDN